MKSLYSKKEKVKDKLGPEQWVIVCVTQFEISSRFRGLVEDSYISEGPVNNEKCKEQYK